MFTDIVGYSALMSKDEKLAMSILEKNRNLHKEAIAKFNGEYIKEVGDGTLAIFHSSFDAVNCAFEIQKACCTERFLNVRIGIHIGDIIESEGDVFGDGVNVASRIEAAGEPGGIYISEKVYDDIKNKAGIRAEFYGEKTLKNIPDPVRIYSVSARDIKSISEKSPPIMESQPPSGMGVMRSRQSFFSRKRTLGIAAIILLAVITLGGYFLIGKKPGTSTSTADTEKSALKSKKQTWTNSIAVLPFTDLSPDKDQEYFCDGMAEELINVLTYIPELQVVARTSAFSFKEKEIDVRDIGEKLNVKTILEGSVRKSGDHLRISAQLIDVKNGYHLWSQTFDRELKDIFEIQEEISSAIVDALKIKLLREDKRQLTEKQTRNQEAHEFYLKGRYFCYKRTEEDMKKSIMYFEKAIAADPDYALAHAGLAEANFLQWYHRWNNWMDGYESGRQSALRALELNRDLPEAYATLGTILLYADWNWEESQKMFKQAIHLNPNYATAHHYYAELLSVLGENEEARAEINYAIELDPVFIMQLLVSYSIFMYERQFDEALETVKRIQEVIPGSDDFPFYLFFVTYFHMGKDSLAIEALQKSIAGDTSVIKTVRYAYDKSGMNGVLNFLIGWMKTKSSRAYINIAWCYSMLKENQSSLIWLEKTMEDRNPDIVFIAIDPDFKILRDEPRFLALIDQMGLTPYYEWAQK